MRVIYEACDGKQFATAMECEAHEKKLENLISSTLFDVMTECKRHEFCSQMCKYYDVTYRRSCRLDDKRPTEWDFGGIENIKED